MYGCKCAFIFASRIEQLAQNYTVSHLRGGGNEWPVSHQSVLGATQQHHPAASLWGARGRSAHCGRWIQPSTQTFIPNRPQHWSGRPKKQPSRAQADSLKIRRIKSDNLRRKSLSDIQQTNGVHHRTPHTSLHSMTQAPSTSYKRTTVRRAGGYTNTAVWWVCLPPLHITTALNFIFLLWNGCASISSTEAVVVWKVESLHYVFLCCWIFFVAKKKKKKKINKKVAADWIKTELDFWKMFYWTTAGLI